MSKSDSYSAARIADRLEIQDNLFRWSRAIDRLDYDAIRSVFHPDAIDSHGPYVGGIEGLIAWIRERHKTITFSLHQLSNILIEFSGPDSALVETTVCTIQRYLPEGKDGLAQLSGGKRGKEGSITDVKSSSRYIDRVERRNGEWKIAGRTVVMGWRSMEDVGPDAPQMMPDWHVQKRDGSDFIYRERAALGIV